MAGNRTLTIIKPDAFGAGRAGQILAHLERGGFRIIAARVLRLSQAQAEAFYEVHRGQARKTAASPIRLRHRLVVFTSSQMSNRTQRDQIQL